MLLFFGAIPLFLLPIPSWKIYFIPYPLDFLIGLLPPVRGLRTPSTIPPALDLAK